MRNRGEFPTGFVSGEMIKGYKLLGKRYGSIVVIKSIGRSSRGNVWLCKCDCGNEINVSTGSLTNGQTHHCGCKYINPSTTHNMRHTRIYAIWTAMKARCNNPNVPHFMDYGGRGIKVSDEWNINFDTFYNDMKEGFADGLQLDRIYNDGDYCKENCRWANPHDQTRNKRNNRWFEKDGKRMVLADWALFLGIRQCRFNNLFAQGKSFDYVYNFYKNKKDESIIQ